MLQPDLTLSPAALLPALTHFWDLSGAKLALIRREYDYRQGSPVFTWAGRYSSRGWTDWTQGFAFGSEILQFDATGDRTCLEAGRQATRTHMAAHVGHFGVHDHGFNNVSTYGNLLRLMQEGRLADNPWERDFYTLALQLSGAVQAHRWTSLPEGGYIYSFNGPHSLFVDTLRTLRALMLSHALGHALWTEQDQRISLLERAVQHAATTARYAIYYGEGRDRYDVRGRTAHESIFNIRDGAYRCPNSQQGYTGFSTWTRGLAWAMLGFAEQLEFMAQVPAAAWKPLGGQAAIAATWRRAAEATCDFYLAHTPPDGIPYWDTGAPGLAQMGAYLDRPADPFNAHEPVDSSAAAIAAQGLLRLGRYLQAQGEASGHTYWQAGLTVARTLLQAPYLSEAPTHQGLLLHAIYHHPNGWDYVPAGSRIPYGEACMWGDYHLRELALYLWRLAHDAPYYTFFGGIAGQLPEAAEGK